MSASESAEKSPTPTPQEKPERHTCSVCNKTYKTKKCLAQHSKIYHREGAAAPKPKKEPMPDPPPHEPDQPKPIRATVRKAPKVLTVKVLELPTKPPKKTPPPPPAESSSTSPFIKPEPTEKQGSKGGASRSEAMHLKPAVHIPSPVVGQFNRPRPAPLPTPKASAAPVKRKFFGSKF